MEHPTIAEPQLRRELGFRDLILFSLAGIIGTRWVAAAARTGSSAVTIWIVTTLVFFLPSAFAVARLSAKYPVTGGIYVWTRETFGEWHGFLCFSTYWLGLVFWFPSALMGYASLVVYAFGPRFVHLADNRAYILAASVAALALVITANIMGLRFGKWIDDIGGISTYAIGATLAVLAGIALWTRGSATRFTLIETPTWDRVNFWSQMAYALSGLELAPILGGEIRDPSRNLPRAALAVAPMIGIFYAVSTAAVLVILPLGAISPMHGVSQSVSAGAALVGVPWLAQITAVLIGLGALGQFSVLGASAARLPYAVGADRFLPAPLARIHPRWRTPHIAILVFGVLAAIVLLFAQLGDTLGSAYQTVTDMMVLTGLAPFLYMFAAAWKHGARWSAALGFASTVLVLICTAVPTHEVANAWMFEAKLWGGFAAVVAAARTLYMRRRRA